MEDLQFTYVMQLALGYWNSHPLFTLVKLHVFEFLDDGPQSFKELNSKVNIPAFSLDVVLKAGIALRLIVKDGDSYSNSPIARSLLVTTSPGSVVNWIKLMNRWSNPWTYLEEAVTIGRQAEINYKSLGDDLEYQIDFILANHEIALVSINDFKQNVIVAGRKDLLDIGGGAGTYSIALCQSNPEIKVRLLELKSVLPISESVVNKYELQDRISLEEVDYTTNDFGIEIADTILLSNMLLQEPLATTKSILSKAYNALKWDGEVIIQGYFLDDASNSTLFTTLINLYATIIWNKSEGCTVQDLLRLLSETGFEFEKIFKLKGTGLSVIKAKKNHGRS
ncbi:methyltransferase family protein [Chitinophaga niastensis]|uniref:Methyltransferase family protein n=1 Tax=Chitinophaga niastensis TaxID=536980 RepID=A0A2P8H9B9_CHINA|nr:methyltransferase [Chitinophaga niastensis]PSL42791.1 methyltransferase family protein [Chitinophaga niastensis]